MTAGCPQLRTGRLVSLFKKSELPERLCMALHNLEEEPSAARATLAGGTKEFAPFKLLTNFLFFRGIRES
jgi:hypothetical protein